MTKAPSPRADALRKMREDAYESQQKRLADLEVKAKTKSVARRGRPKSAVAGPSPKSAVAEG